MPNIQSASKRMRQNAKRRAENRTQRSTMRTSVKKLNQSVEGGDAAQAAELLQGVIRILGKSGQKRLIHRKNASRKISRLTRKVQAMGAGSKPAESAS